MSITRIFFDSRLKAGGVVPLSEEEGHHVYKVLRGRVGEKIEVVDGAGRLFVAELTSRREATVLEERPTEGSEDVAITLYQAVPKGRHMDLVVEKATELGVRDIVPLVTERVVVRLSEEDGKVWRWRRVAEAAARQSLRFSIPEVREATPFSEAVREVGESSGVLLHNEPGLPALEDAVRGCSAVSLLVGPEGGWSAGELATAEESGLRLASLGPYRLRSETAGIAAVARAWAALEHEKSFGRSR